MKIGYTVRFNMALVNNLDLELENEKIYISNLKILSTHINLYPLSCWQRNWSIHLNFKLNVLTNNWTIYNIISNFQYLSTVKPNDALSKGFGKP